MWSVISIILCSSIVIAWPTDVPTEYLYNETNWVHRTEDPCIVTEWDG